MLKKILIFLIILILLVLAGVFVVNKSAGAQSQTYKNLTKAFPDGCVKTDGKVISETPNDRYIRMQIAIPGVTSSCVKDGKTYHYVSSNLPEYVKNFYNFAVGAIAIIAVIMIMIGGLQWIFAAGNPGAITTAKSNILSAISGLVLILFSYVLLYTINPNLVNLSLTNPRPIAGIEQGTFWCMDLDEKTTNGNKFIFYEEGHFGDSNYILTKREDTLCYKKYYFTYRDSTGKLVKPKEDKFCYGNDCDNSSEVCVGEMGFTYCIDPVDLCEKKTDVKNCKDVNESFAKMSSQPDVLENSCFARDDAWYKWALLGGRDECSWDEIIVCPGSSERVSCLSGTVVDADKKTGCYDKSKQPAYVKNEAVYYYCSDSAYTNQDTSLICCKSGDKFELYGAKGKIDGYESAPYAPLYATTIDCNSKKRCEDYSNGYDISKEACLRNICQVPYACQWSGSACKAKN